MNPTPPNELAELAKLEREIAEERRRLRESIGAPERTGLNQLHREHGLNENHAPPLSA